MVPDDKTIPDYCKTLHEGVMKELVEIKALLAAQNGRLRTVELWKARMEGAGMATKTAWLILVAVVSLAAGIIGGWLKSNG